MTIRLIPVLDLKAGRAVHAVGGDRAHYQPVRSILHKNADPVALGRAFRERLGLSELYLADLDAIAGAPPSVGTYRALHALGLRLWLDAGIRDTTSLAPGWETRVETIVVGSETVRGPAALAEIAANLGPERVVFSLDLDQGRPRIAAGADWGSSDPQAIADAAVAAGVRRVLVLDLGRVGTGQGFGARTLLQTLATTHPGLELSAGGGVAGRADLDELAQLGAAAALVGSALHDGRIARD